MTTTKRRDVFWVEWEPGRGSEQSGRRPGLIVQTDSANSNRGYENTIVLAISSQAKRVSFHVPIQPTESNGLTKPSYVKCEQILTISKERLLKKMGTLSETDMKEVEKAIRTVLDLI